MKKILITLTVIILIISIIAGGLYFYLTTAYSREMKKGTDLVQEIYTADNNNLNDIKTVLFIGDSIASGVESDNYIHYEELGFQRQVVDLLPNVTKTYSFAVPGYKSADVLKDIEQDVNTTHVTEQIIDDGFLHPNQKDELTAYYKEQKNTSLSNAIKESDIIILTAGANDILNNIKTTDGQGLEIDYPGLRTSFSNTKTNKKAIVEAIRDINPRTTIFDIGIYFAYPFIGDDYVEQYYPILVIAETQLFINKPSKNTHYVNVRTAINSDLKSYINNPDNIHPSEPGYEVIANEILKSINDNYK